MTPKFDTQNQNDVAMIRDYYMTLANSISTTNYIAVLRVLLSLPATLTPGRAFTTREHNAIRKANLLKKRFVKLHRRAQQKRPICERHN